MREAAPFGVGQLCDLQFAVVALVGQQPVEGRVAELLQVDATLGVRRCPGIGALGEIILIQLNPKVVECIGRGVMVSHRSHGRDRTLLVVEFGADIVVGPVLPIAGARGARGEALGGGRRQDRIQLLELLDGRTGLGRERGQGEEQGQQSSHAMGLSRKGSCRETFSAKRGINRTP